MAMVNVPAVFSSRDGSGDRLGRRAALAAAATWTIKPAGAIMTTTDIHATLNSRQGPAGVLMSISARHHYHRLHGHIDI
jgi:hypothetical protein